ncbi:MAG: TIGR02270 family protein [Gammaproteobacteria bacterium]|nr:TIGR02270 family protein [Gammaproteobacteria bacterium]
MDITQTNFSADSHSQRENLEHCVTEAAFLWLLRSVQVDQPRYTIREMADLEQRIDAQLDGLMVSIDQGWEVCAAALDGGDPGAVFTAAVIALRSHDVPKIQRAVQAGVANDRSLNGLISALGWVPAVIVQPWRDKFLLSKDLKHKYLGVAACSVRRENPGELLTELLAREDCRQHAKFYTRALRLIGELRRQDLMPVLETALTESNPEVLFWAAWSSLLLGRVEVIKHLRPLVLQRGPYQEWAIQLIFRVLGVETGREWVSALAKNKTQIRAVIKATAVLGDPHAVNWLIAKMADPLLTRLAGEAFTFITGVDLEQQQLHLPAPDIPPSVSADDVTDTHVGLDEDDDLPFPNADKVAEFWRRQGEHFLMGRRYFLGKPLSAAWLKTVLKAATQRQRHAAALELALIDSHSPLLNTRARVPGVS